MTSPKKRCSVCHRTLAATSKNFHKGGQYSKDGLHTQCRKCRHELYLRSQGRKPRKNETLITRRRKSPNGTPPTAAPAVAAPTPAPQGRVIEWQMQRDVISFNGTLYLPITAFAAALGVPEREIVELVNA